MKAQRQRKGIIITKAGSCKLEKKKIAQKGSKTNKPKSWFCGKANKEQEKRIKIQIKELIRANTQI